MLNKYMIIGNLGQDPEHTKLDSGTSVCRLSVATNRKWKNKDGELQEETTWHRVTVWGNQADACAEYLKKGRQVYVEGRFQSREYEKEGEKRWSAECVAERVVFLSNKGSGSSGRDDVPPPSDDDIPF